MGGVCCVAGRDKTVENGSSSDVCHRNIRSSPTWSFRWDHRGRVAGEDTSITWFSDGISRNDMKFESSHVSEDGSPISSFQPSTGPKSQTSQGYAAHSRTPASDQSISRNISMDTSLEEVKELTEFPAVSNPFPGKLSLSLPSTSSLPVSPLSRSHFQPASSIMPRWTHTHHSSTNQLTGQASVTQISGFRSSNSFSVHEESSLPPAWNNESAQGSQGGSLDGWSMHAFSELMASSHEERCLFDIESLTLSHGKSKCRVSASSSVDLQTCGICTKLLTEKSFWSSQKLVATNELSVVAILTCGHVYHAECLDTMTCELDKYDPSCPICTLGEKQTLKLSQKALKAEMDLKAKNKRSRNRVGDSDFNGDSYKGPKMASSSSMKSSSAKPFLRRHFSFGGKGNKSSTDDHSTRKKGFFWTRSLKV